MGLQSDLLEVRAALAPLEIGMSGQMQMTQKSPVKRKAKGLAPPGPGTPSRSPFPSPAIDGRLKWLWPGEFEQRYATQSVLHDGGHQCRVLLVTCNKTNLEFVAKITGKSATRSGDEEWARANARVMAELPEHKSVVQVHKVYECDEFFYVVMDACMGGDLHDFFQCLEDNDLAFERELRGIMGQVLQGLNHLHQQGLVHNDVKLENFVFQLPSATASPPAVAKPTHQRRLSAGGAREKLMQTISKRKTPQLKLIDFDFMRPDGASADAVLGTDGYIAPEAYKFQPCAKSDVFSAGVLMYVLVTGEFPYPDEIFVDTPETNYAGSPVMAEIYAALEAAQENVPWDGPWDALPDARNFCRELLTFAVGSRPSAVEALQNPWVRV